MQGQKKKKKYVEKPVNYIQKIQEKQSKNICKQKPGIKTENVQQADQYHQKTYPKTNKTTVVNVKVKFLRNQGYNSLLQWLQNPDHVYIGRNMAHYVPGANASKWANPFKVDKFGRQACIQQYRKYIKGQENMMKQLKQLKGKVLGCWCAPEGCHGDVLAQLADIIDD